ncbi:hypothetical protein KLP28_05610 [Nocardioidaceae bacterium]|nr:hypothetical protein KLP28_05610 [Nocardioidaceae bacterium]
MVLALGPAVVVGVPAWVGVVVVRTSLASPTRPRPALVVRTAPWATAALALGLFCCAAAAAPFVREAFSGSRGDVVSLAAGGALLANTVDNLPAYLALAPLAHDDVSRTALLVGVDAGPLVTPWASVATLLWLRVCRAHGVRLGLRELGRLAGEGAVVASLAVSAGTAALLLVHG